LLICCISFNARPHAAVNVILQARSRPFAVDLNIAVTYQEVSFDQFGTFPRKSRGKKRPKIQSSIFGDAPRNHRSRKGLVYSELKIRIGFVVAQQNVVLGLVLLDEVIFKGECFAFGVGHDELDVFDCVHHLVLALVEIARQLEIGSYAVPQRFGFSHVDRLIRSILIEVHAGPGRNAIEFGFKNGVHGSIRGQKPIAGGGLWAVNELGSRSLPPGRGRRDARVRVPVSANLEALTLFLQLRPIGLALRALSQRERVDSPCSLSLNDYNNRADTRSATSGTIFSLSK